MTTIVRRPRTAPNAPTGVVLGIDQSYSGFAVCILTPDNHTYEMHRRSFDPENYGQGIDRLNEIGAWLRKIIYDTPQQIDHVCMEGYAPGSKFGREIAGELGATVKHSLRLHPRLWDPACYPTIVPPTSLKLFTTGKGGSKKEDMKLAAFKRWGVEFKTNDEVDAYSLCQIASAIQWGSSNLTAYQAEVVARLKRNTERR